jgi:hypothetical protein
MDVERPEVIWGFARVQQYSPKQKTGKDKEQIDPAPRQLACGLYKYPEPIWIRRDLTDDKMKNQDKPYGQTANAVEFRNASVRQQGKGIQYTPDLRLHEEEAVLFDRNFENSRR